MDSRITTSADLAKIFRNNAQRIIEEYTRAGYNPREVKSAFSRAASDGRCRTLLEGDVPLAAIMWDADDTAIVTSFAAREDFFASRTVRFCKKYIREIQQQQGGKSVHAYSFSTHSRVARWFEAIGFAQTTSEGNYTLYQLPALPSL